MTFPTIDRRWAIPVAIILFGSICYFVGRKSQKQEDALAANHTQIVQSDKHTDSVQKRTTDSRKKDAVLDSTRDVIRTKVLVRHDSVFARDTVYVSPDIAQLIQADDSLIAAQKHSLALQDTLIASLRVGLSLRDQRIKILEAEVTPSKLKRILNASKWLAIGTVVGLAASHK